MLQIPEIMWIYSNVCLQQTDRGGRDSLFRKKLQLLKARALRFPSESMESPLQGQMRTEQEWKTYHS